MPNCDALAGYPIVQFVAGVDQAAHSLNCIMIYERAMVKCWIIPGIYNQYRAQVDLLQRGRTKYAMDQTGIKYNQSVGLSPDILV